MTQVEDFNPGEEPSPEDPSHPGDHPFPRWMVAGVFVFSVLVLVVAYKQMQTNLILDIPILGEGIKPLTSAPTSILDLDDDKLRLQDSDADGLSDYQELKLYGSSPFIADTDSDGRTDAEEVQEGSDPNCPQGQLCSLAIESEGVINEPTSEFQTPEVAELLNDPVRLRQLLIAAGADPLLINNLDDQTIQLLATEAFAALTGPTPEKFEALADLGPAEIRNLLLESGATEEELANVTDEELLEVYAVVLQYQQESSGL